MVSAAQQQVSGKFHSVHFLLLKKKRAEKKKSGRSLTCDATEMDGEVQGKSAFSRWLSSIFYSS